MGISFSFPVECTSTCCWDFFIGEAKYTRDLSKNLKSLEKLLPEISTQKTEILSQVQDVELVQGYRRLPIVDAWLTRVATAEIEVSKLIQDGPQEIQRLCLCGYCSKSYISSYKFGKEVAQQLNAVQILLAKAQEESFKQVIGHQRLNQVDLIPLEPPIGLDSTFDKVWSCIQDGEVGIIGLYGPQGIGKTTLLKQINNKFADKDFVVVWVVASKGCNPEKLQEDIGKRIGFSDDSWKSKSYDEKARDILRVLNKKKFVLLLDDVWEHVDLTVMGIPIPNKSNGSKIIFTTRPFQVCGQLRANQKIKVDYLAFEDAFKLFCQKVGEDTLASDPKIFEISQTVVKECAGLPLALITVARAMTGKQTTREWDYAVECLKKYAAEFPTMTGKVYSLLKFSYDKLPSEKVLKMLLLDDEKKKPIAVGPWGGPGGSSWDDFPYSSVKKIVIVHGVGIDSIQIEYDVNGTSGWSPKHGGPGGAITDKVELDYPNEYLIEMHGHYGRMYGFGPDFIRSLSFESNKKKYGPYGQEEGTYFSIPTSEALIAGFHGTSGLYLDSIGIYLRPIQD